MIIQQIAGALFCLSSLVVAQGQPPGFELTPAAVIDHLRGYLNQDPDCFPDGELKNQVGAAVDRLEEGLRMGLIWEGDLPPGRGQACVSNHLPREFGWSFPGPLGSEWIGPAEYMMVDFDEIRPVYDQLVDRGMSSEDAANLVMDTAAPLFFHEARHVDQSALIFPDQDSRECDAYTKAHELADTLLTHCPDTFDEPDPDGGHPGNLRGRIMAAAREAAQEGIDRYCD